MHKEGANVMVSVIWYVVSEQFHDYFPLNLISLNYFPLTGLIVLYALNLYIFKWKLEVSLIVPAICFVTGNKDISIYETYGS